jgi:hypothetical protein
MSVVKINMTKAREIWRKKISVEAEAKIEKLRPVYDKIVDDGGDTSVVIAKRKALRALASDPAIDAAQTPEQLKAFWPSILSEEIG